MGHTPIRRIGRGKDDSLYYNAHPMGDTDYFGRFFDLIDFHSLCAMTTQ
jgi:hypothetical protein